RSESSGRTAGWASFLRQGHSILTGMLLFPRPFHKRRCDRSAVDQPKAGTNLHYNDPAWGPPSRADFFAYRKREPQRPQEGELSLVGQLKNAWPTRERSRMPLTGNSFRESSAPWLAKKGRDTPPALAQRAVEPCPQRRNEANDSRFVYCHCGAA